MMRRTKYTLPEYDDSIHTNEIDIRDHYREMNVDYTNEYKDNNGHQDYENMPPAHHQGMKFMEFIMMHLDWYLLKFLLNISLTEPEHIIIPRTLTAEIHAAIQSVRFIAQHIKDADKDNEVSFMGNFFKIRKLSLKI